VARLGHPARDLVPRAEAVVLQQGANGIEMRSEPGPAMGHGLAFARNCFYQYCMVYNMQKGGRGGSYLAQKSCNTIATVWALQVGGGNEMIIVSFTNALK